MTIKSTRVRSPAYPSISLKEAVKKADAYYKKEGRNEAYLSVALTHWGYSASSGNGLKLVAALSSFGLVDVSGSGKNRKLKLSAAALKVILDTRDSSNEKLQTIQNLALKPKIYRKLWNLWGADLPSDGNIRHHLIFDEAFNEKFVGGFIKDYRETIEFSQLSESILANTSNVDSEENDEDEDDLEGFESGSEINTSQKKKASSISASSLSLSEGEIEIAKYPVAKNCTIRVIANGEYNRKAIEALVAQLNLNLELGIFDDDLNSEI